MIHKLKLGMPHLNYYGLDQQWLLKQVGHHHWTLLSSGPALNRDNERLYASFFCCHLNFNKGQDQYHESDDLTINSTLFKYNSQIYRSTHSIANGRNLATATLDSVFVKKNMNTNQLVREDPYHNVNQISQVDQVFLDEHRKIKKELRNAVLDDMIELPFSPETNFNAVKILYFANYVGLVSQCEWLSDPRLKGPIKDLKIYYFANIEVGDQVYGRTVQQDNVYTTTLMANNHALAQCVITR